MEKLYIWPAIRNSIEWQYVCPAKVANREVKGSEDAAKMSLRLLLIIMLMLGGILLIKENK